MASLSFAPVDVFASGPPSGNPLAVVDNLVADTMQAFARWLGDTGQVAARHVAAQGQAVGAAGRVEIVRDDRGLRVGGRVTVVVDGHTRFGSSDEKGHPP